MAVLLDQAWDLEVDRGPGWLFVRLHGGGFDADEVADRLWDILNKHFVHRVVLEMEDIEFLPSSLLGQLVMLQKRVMQRGGALRLCGLSPQCHETLHLCRLDQILPCYQNRDDAIRCFVNNRSFVPKPR